MTTIESLYLLSCTYSWEEDHVFENPTSYPSGNLPQLLIKHENIYKKKKKSRKSKPRKYMPGGCGLMLKVELILYKCNDCNKEFKSKTSLRQHSEIHIQFEKPYKCSDCDKQFAFPDNLRRHSYIHFGNRKRTFVCDVCNKRFKHSTSLTYHKRIHTGDKVYQCDICARKFNYLAGLKYHMNTHTESKPFICEFCGKQYKHIAGRCQNTYFS